MPKMRVKLAMMAKPAYYGVIRVVCPFCREELRTSDRALLKGTHCKNSECKAKIRYVPVAQREEKGNVVEEHEQKI